MDYRGHFQDGVVRPDVPVNLPEGTPVEFHAVNGASHDQFMRRSSRDFFANRTLEEMIDRSKPLASIDDLAIDWPPDENVDEFIRQVKGRR